MCQKVAHTFGLGHQSEGGSSQNSCMDYCSNTGANAGSTLSTLQDFAQSDVDISDDSASWGALVSQSRNGRSSTYERYNANGSRTLTHVFWTL